MSSQVLAAAVAIAVGLALAAALFVPFVYLNYRRRGRLTLLRTALWTSFLVYAMALWTYTLLPLPDPDDIRCAPAQLVPFRFLADIRHYDTAGAAALAHNPAVQQVAFNVLLFLPLGVLLRWLWARGILWSTAAGLLISLLIETTQLTGVWGVYPCAYRLFDVDDLMANTTGALLGGIAAAVVVRLRRMADASGRRAGQTSPRPGADPAAPTAQELPQLRTGVQTGTATGPGSAASSGSAAASARMPQISARRRLLGAVCDLVIAGGLGFAVTVTLGLFQTVLLPGALGSPGTADPTLSQQLGLWVPITLTAACTLLTGRTPGDHTVAIRFVPTGTRATTARSSPAQAPPPAGSPTASMASAAAPEGSSPRDQETMTAPPETGASALASPSRTALLPRIALRWAAGIGGCQLLAVSSGGGLLGLVPLLFAVVSAVMILRTADRGGLPGALARLSPVDDSLAGRARRADLAARPSSAE
ncbi:VanZ family protein [Brevibacterium album]|uniref:VanZ family protein n=1 Tax=Brevibacterium album TaxID=417948 RepID=UPI000402F228|nr:VanZ family protein [Brevibacterium album]